MDCYWLEESHISLHVLMVTYYPINRGSCTLYAALYAKMPSNKTMMVQDVLNCCMEQQKVFEMTLTASNLPCKIFPIYIHKEDQILIIIIA